MLLGREPALWLSLASAIIALAVGFGLNISNENQALIMTGITAVIGFMIRSVVTPNVSVVASVQRNTVLSAEKGESVVTVVPGAAAEQGALIESQGGSISAKNLMIALFLVPTLALLSACAPKNLGPTVTDVGRAAWTADRVITATSAALDGVEVLVSAGQIPKPVGVTIAKAGEAVGNGGKTLADALDAYRVQPSGEGWTKVINAIEAIRVTLNGALDGVPQEHRDKVRGVLQPIFDAALAILTTIRPPVTA